MSEATRPRLSSLEHSPPLVVRHGLVEEALLGTRVVKVMVDDLVAEGGPRRRSALERLDRLVERRREARGVRFVGVPLERRRQLELVLDAVQAGGEQRREVR